MSKLNLKPVLSGSDEPPSQFSSILALLKNVQWKMRLCGEEKFLDSSSLSPDT